MDFLKFLKRINMKQSDFAIKLNYSPTLVNAWVTGRAFPSYEKIIDLINAGITAEELFGEEIKEKLFHSVQHHSEDFKENLIDDVLDRIIKGINYVKK